MARIAGVNIPTNKRVLVALQYIHGIGPKIAAEIMGKVKIPEDRRVSQLSDQEVLQIREVIDRDFVVEGDLRRETGINIKRLAAYRAQTEPLIHYYSERRKLLTVDGMMAIEAVTREIGRILSAIGAVEKKTPKKPAPAKRDPGLAGSAPDRAGKSAAKRATKGRAKPKKASRPALRAGKRAAKRVKKAASRAVPRPAKKVTKKRAKA